MLRLNGMDLPTIFNLVETDGDGIDESVNLLNTIPGESIESIGQLTPGAQSVIENYLKAKCDRAETSYPNFHSRVNNTVCYVIKMSLLMSNHIINQDMNDEMREKYFQHVEALFRSAKDIFRQNDLDSLLFLFLKLNAFSQIPLVRDYIESKGFYNSVKQELADLCNRALLVFPPASDRDKTCLNYMRVIKEIVNLPDYAAWLTDFVKQTRAFVESRRGYPERELALKFISPAWEKIKSELSLEDIDWFISMIKSLEGGLNRSHASGRGVLFELFRFGVYMNVTGNSSLSLLVYFVVALQGGYFIFSKSERNAVLNFLADNQELRAQSPDRFNQQQLAYSDSLNNMFMERYNIQGEDYRAQYDSEINFRNMMIIFLIAQLAAYFAYRVNAYRQNAMFRPAAPAPVMSVPEWCVARRLELLDKQRPDPN